MLMRQCGWSLLMGEARVFDIRQLREHFDTALMTGYLLGGTLERWLAEAGETEILSRIKEIDYSAYSEDLGEQLEFIFGVRPEKKTKLPENILKALSARKKADPPKTAFRCSSFKASSLRSGSARTSSFRFVRHGSGRHTVMWHSISQQSTSWRSALWYGGSWKNAFWRTGSFRFLGSGYMFRTYLGSASWRAGSGGSFSGLQRAQKGSFSGSFLYFAGEAEITEQEYHRTMINLSSCPLNEYGYGIHLI